MPTSAARTLALGTVIPAHPLALTERLTIDIARQRALTRYYLDAGAGGIAIGVHATQFEIRDTVHSLFEPVLALTAEELNTHAASGVVRIAGVAGPTRQAVREAETACLLGYDAVLVSPQIDDPTPGRLLDRARAIAQVMPIIGFYLQPAIGGPVLDRHFWREFCQIEAVVAIKAAPFDRYRTLELMRGVAESGRAHQIALYTGNDDAIIPDLLSEYHLPGPDGPVTLRFVGGLLGQWAIGTRAAVRMLGLAHRAAAGDDRARTELNRISTDLLDINQALFDPANNFQGVIPGVHELLRQQGLLAGTWCLDPAATLSPRQAAEITRVRRTYPHLCDEKFIAENLEGWLT